MRKTALTTIVASATLALAACTDANQDEAEATAQPIAAVADGDPAQTTATLNANLATADQLGAAGLPARAIEAVVSGRPFPSVVELNAKLRETLSGQPANAALENVFIPVNLNTASEEEIKLIPGMTDRMVHEFLEYRPYKDIAEFDREIGKYVSAAEVARFRRYVTL